MAEVGAQLPAGTTTITERQTPSVFPIISFVVTGGRDPSALHDYAYYDLRPRISRIPDVSYVTVQGGDIREILIEVDPQALVAANLSIADVADRLAKEHRLKAVGRLDRGTLQYQVLADTLAIDPLDLEDRVIVEKNGQSIRLRDLGRVDDRARGPDDGDPVQRQGRRRPDRLPPAGRQCAGRLARPGGRAGRRRQERSARSRDPSGLRSGAAGQHGDRQRPRRHRDRRPHERRRPPAVPQKHPGHADRRAVDPTLLIITFVFLYLTGDTLNLMSLGGLAVAIGLIIDDTVVVIENIARHLAGGETGDGAVDRASREISGAVIGSTLTTILVFVPLAFVSGVVGQFFQSLSLSLSVALLVSMVVSLTIIPVLAARFLGRRPMPTTGPVYNLVADGYEGLLKVGLRFPITAMLLSLLAIVPLWWLATHMETGFMPDMDEGAFVLDYEMPVGTSLAQTDKVMRRVEDVLLETPDISGYIRRTGAELGFFATESYTGDILVSLKPAGQRRPAEEIFEALREELEEDGPRARDRVRAAGAGPDQRPGGRRQPDRGQGFRPRLRRSCASWPSRSARSSRRSTAWPT